MAADFIYQNLTIKYEYNNSPPFLKIPAKVGKQCKFIETKDIDLCISYFVEIIFKERKQIKPLIHKVMSKKTWDNGK